MNKDELKNLYPKMPEQFMETVNKSVSDGLTVNGKVIRMKKKIFLNVLQSMFRLQIFLMIFIKEWQAFFGHRWKKMKQILQK